MRDSSSVLPPRNDTLGGSSRAVLKEQSPSALSRSLRKTWLIAATGAVVLGPVFLAVWSNLPVPVPRVIKTRQLTYAATALLESNEHPLLTDGPRVFATVWTGSQQAIWSVAATSESGEMTPITSGFQQPAALDLSPDGATLLVATGQGTPLWLLPVLGGSPRPLGNLHADAAAWSPDGRKLLYSVGRDLYVAESDGASSRKIATAPEGTWYASSPRWSPDGSLVRLTLLDGERESNSLWEVRAEGGRLRPLLSGWKEGQRVCCGNWTPDGRFYVFTAYRDGQWSLWAIRKRRPLEWKWPRPVPVAPGSIDYREPLASKDGKELFALGRQKLGELTRYDRQSNQFVLYLGGISAGDASFSSDGQWVAYVTYPQGDLWRSRTDGSEKLQLTFPPLTSDSPHWSPDGRQIAFRAGEPGQPRKIHLVPADGGQPAKLMPWSATEDGVPTWSPDGRRILFGEVRWHPERIGIHIIDLATRGVSTVPGSQGLWTPRWSPSGRYILAVTADNQEIRLFDFHTESWRKLGGNVVAGVGGINDPNWSHDELYVYFNVSPADPKRAIYRLRVSDGKLELVKSLKDLRTAFGAASFGNWFGLAPDDSPLVLSDARNWEIYALDVEWP